MHGPLVVETDTVKLLSLLSGVRELISLGIVLSLACSIMWKVGSGKAYSTLKMGHYIISIPCKGTIVPIAVVNMVLVKTVHHLQPDASFSLAS